MNFDLLNENCKNWGVYKITNIINNDIYIGSTSSSFKDRWSQHIRYFYLYKNDTTRKPSCPLLYKAFNKYEFKNFKFEIIISFNRKKELSINKKIATFLEERLIKKLNPKYNICQKPTLSGCPNLGRKLTKEWKDKISSKSKLYKHKDNNDIYLKKQKQNKDLSSLYSMYNSITKENLIGSLIDLSVRTKISDITIIKYSTLDKEYKGFKITKIRSQKKRIKILINSLEFKIFNSFGECDRFLNMWRGYTSSCVVDNKDKILNFKYNLI